MKLKFHRAADAIEVGVSPEGHRMFRVGRRRSWVLIPLRLPNWVVTRIARAKSK